MNMKKKDVRVEVRLYRYYAPSSINDLAKWLRTEVKEEVPKEYRDKVEVDLFNTAWNYDGHEESCPMLVYYRPETDAEFKIRKEERVQMLAKSKELELKKLAELKKKYGDSSR